MTDATLVALVGQPNSGKTTLFNRLTGSNQKVGNYPGVTVEHRTGAWRMPDGSDLKLVDLPGLYELGGSGREEALSAESLLGWHDDLAAPAAAIVVVDVTTIERGLQLVAEVRAVGMPFVLALNMADIAEQEGVQVDRDKLSAALGATVVTISARQGQGLEALATAVRALQARAAPVAEEQERVRGEMLAHGLARDPEFWRRSRAAGSMQADPAPWQARKLQLSAQVEAWIAQAIRRKPVAVLRQRSERLDDWLLHPVWGMAVFLTVMFVVFQSVYAWSEPLTGLVESLIAGLGDLAVAQMAPGLLRELVVDAALGGAGNVLVFLPQIVILFFWIAVLEETGYLSRVAFMLDQPMRAAGLSGRSFLPLLSSYACAVPGIMAARTIEDARTRLITILVAPLMTCSARLPVYALLLGVFVPDRAVLPGINLRGLVLFGLYAAGVGGGLLIAALVRRQVRRGVPLPMLIELPIYRVPVWRNVLRTLVERAGQFVKRAGTTIFALSLVLWLGLNFPRDLEREAQLTEAEAAAYRVENSAAGMLGHAIEPVIAPLGFDWKIGIGLVASFAAREVMVATMGTIYRVQDASEESGSLRAAMAADPVWSLPVALALLVWYVFALQCVSTVAIMRRELAGWRWPLFALGSTYGLAWILGALTYQLSRWAGL